MSSRKETEFGIIPMHWDFIRASEYCSKVTDGTHDSPKQQTTGRYLITSKHIKGREIDFESAYLISQEDFEKINKRSYVGQWDVIISMIGEYCGFTYIERNEKIDYAVKNVGLFKTGSELNALWLYYFLNSTIGKYILDINKSGSSQPYIALGSLRELPILIPPHKEKTAIVSMLSSLDDKIDLLHRQNATLEKMAETLFRQWFVEEAKEEWETMPLSQMANFLNGLACQKFPPKNEIDKLPVLKIKELSSGINENSDWASTEIKSEYIVRNGDVIFAWSASLMVKIWDGQDCILNQHLFKVTSEDYPKWFYYMWCKHHLAEFISIAASHATTMGHIKRGDLDEAKVLIPSPAELAAMTEQAEPLIQKIIANNIQINTLIKLRDSLLPKLMSGEITVEP